MTDDLRLAPNGSLDQDLKKVPSRKQTRAEEERGKHGEERGPQRRRVCCLCLPASSVRASQRSPSLLNKRGNSTPETLSEHLLSPSRRSPRVQSSTPESRRVALPPSAAFASPISLPASQLGVSLHLFQQIEPRAQCTGTVCFSAGDE